MQFDARAAKLLEPGRHLTIDGYLELRLEATARTRTWIYRYKSPVDDRMRQKKMGRWPATSFAAAVVEWESLRQMRDAGVDVAVEAKQERQAAKAAAAAAREKAKGMLTVLDACDLYHAGHIKHHRAEKGQVEIRRMFNTMLGDIADKPAEAITRADAFALIESFAHIPVQAQILRRELGAAWGYCHDAGKLAENVLNWWRAVLRGKLKSKGKAINGRKSGVKKRVPFAEGGW